MTIPSLEHLSDGQYRGRTGLIEQDGTGMTGRCDDVLPVDDARSYDRHGYDEEVDVLVQHLTSQIRFPNEGERKREMRGGSSFLVIGCHEKGEKKRSCASNS